MTRRIWFLVVVLAAAGFGRWRVQAVEPAQASDLSRLPVALAEWKGRPGPRFDASVLQVLGADDHVSRIYRSQAGEAALFVSYHRSQKSGAAIHSPLNCLPGSGWQPLSTERKPFGSKGAVQQVVIQKGDVKQLVVYWYQSLDRLEGDEYRSKFYLVIDAVRSGRNDAALVRISVPIDARRPDGEAAAAKAAYRLAELAEPEIRKVLFPVNS